MSLMDGAEMTDVTVAGQ